MLILINTTHIICLCLQRLHCLKARTRSWGTAIVGPVRQDMQGIRAVMNHFISRTFPPIFNNCMEFLSGSSSRTYNSSFKQSNTTGIQYKGNYSVAKNGHHGYNPSDYWFHIFHFMCPCSVCRLWSGYHLLAHSK